MNYSDIILADKPTGYWRLGENASAYASVVLADAPVAYWRLDEPSGTFIDKVSGLVGTLTGGVTRGQPGPLADGPSAVVFNGTTGFIDVPDTPLLDGWGDFVVECWVFPTGVVDLQELLLKSVPASSPTRSWEIYFMGTAGARQVSAFLNGNASGAITSAVGSVPINAWTHVALMRTGSTVQWYINGVASGAPVVFGTPLINSTDPLRMGRGAGGSFQFYQGGLDEVACYAHALPAASLAAHAALRPVALDSSGNAHPGTISGGVTLGQSGAVNDGNTAAAFDGTTGYVALANSGPAMDLPGAVTIEAWVKLSSSPNPDNWVISRSGITYQDYSLHFPTLDGGVSHRLSFNYFGASGGWIDVQGVVIPRGVWTHVAVTRNAPGTLISFYSNGVLTNTAAGAGLASNPAPGRNIGYDPGTPGFFKGALDEVAIYPYALSPAQIAAHYAMGSSYFSRILADAPVGYWRLGETSGTIAADASGKAHPGTYLGGVTLGGAGAIAGDGAAAFDGVNDSVYAPGVTLSATPTVEAWVNPLSAINGSLRIVSSSTLGGTSSNFPFELAITGGGDPRISFFVNFTTLTPGWLGTTFSLPYNAWTHVAMSWDGTTLRIYANGVQVYSNATWAGRVLLSATEFLIGSAIGGTGVWLGALDEVALYSVALTAAQINAHYLMGVPSYFQRVLADYPTGYWRLGEPSGTTAVDSSGNGQTGTYSVGGVTLAQPGAIASDPAALFDGADTTKAAIPPSGSLNALTGSSAVTLEAWVYPLAVPTGTYRIAISFTNAAASYLGLEEASGIKAIIALNVGAGQQSVAAPIALGVWSHLCATYDGAAITLYINGVQVGRSAGLSGALGLGNQGMWLGGYNGVGSSFNGRVDECAIYGYAFTAAQVAAHYQARALPSTAGSYSYQVVQDGASNYWRLNEASGLTAVDSIGGKNGTISGDVTLNQPGALAGGDKAMRFGGVNGKIQTATLSVPATFTIEAMVKASLVLQRPVVSGRAPGGFAALLLYFGTSSTGRARFYVNGEFVGTRVIAGDGAWHHVVGVSNGTTFQIYIDGALDATTTHAANATDSGQLTIGYDLVDLGSFTGSLDEVAIYPYALNAQQVAAHSAAKSRVAGIPWWTQIGSEVLLGSV